MVLPAFVSRGGEYGLRHARRQRRPIFRRDEHAYPRSSRTRSAVVTRRPDSVREYRDEEGVFFIAIAGGL